MKAGPSALGSITIAGVAFLAGLMASEFIGLGQSNGIVKIRNTADMPLHKVEVEIATCGHRAVITTGTVAVGGTVEVRYEICGEGGQTIRATLQDGKTLAGCEAYVESGYRSTVKVSSSAVQC